MKNATKLFGAALLALALLVVPALAVTDVIDHGIEQSQQPVKPGPVTAAFMWIAALGVVGTTITYLFPVSNTTTAPTAAQSSQVPCVVALVNFADADTTAALSHNMGIATAAGFAGDQPNIAQGFPQVLMSWTATSTVAATVSYTNTSGNVVTLTKASLLGTAGTLMVWIRQPNTIGL